MLDLLIYLILSYIILGFYEFYKALKIRHLRRIIGDIQTSRIRSVALGCVELYGRVVLFNDEFILAPFSQKKCIYSRWVIELKVYSRGGYVWRKVKSGVEFKNFLIQDDTGSLLVNPQNAQLDIKSEEYLTFEKFPNSVIEKTLSINSGFSFKKKEEQKFRFKEYNLYEGDKIYVLGYAKKNSNFKGLNALKNTDNLIITKGVFDNLFYISDTPERDLVKKLDKKISYGLYKIPIFIVFGMVIIYFSIKYFL